MSDILEYYNRLMKHDWYYGEHGDDESRLHSMQEQEQLRVESEKSRNHDALFRLFIGHHYYDAPHENIEKFVKKIQQTG